MALPKTSNFLSQFVLPLTLTTGALSCYAQESPCNNDDIDWGQEMEGEVMCIDGQEARVFKPEGWGSDGDGDGIPDGFNAWYVLHGSSGAFLDKEGKVIANDVRLLTQTLMSDPSQNNMVIVVDQYSPRGYFPHQGSDPEDKPSRKERLKDISSLIEFARGDLDFVTNGKVGIIGNSQGGEVATMHALGHIEGVRADFYMSFYGGCGYREEGSKNQAPLVIASSDPNKDEVVRYCPELKENIEANEGIDFDFKMYPGAQHGFLRADDDPKWNVEDLYAQDGALNLLMRRADEFMGTDYGVV